MKKVAIFLFALLIGALITLGAVGIFVNNNQSQANRLHSNNSYDTPARFVNKSAANTPANFVSAANRALPAVVHIAVSATPQASGRQFDPRMIPDPFRDFFQDRNTPPQIQPNTPQRQGSGSGVIISYDGYIITNNHVVDNAEEVEVTLNDQRQYQAKVIGTDPSTDIALIKIKESSLEYLNFANSDEIQIGEWVLAVGNPFNLASTVTAGIVSAKGRNINILQDQMPIESFIQTDAVVNPGNSGGALINLQGELVGINTAIASPTGVYAGYAFAVPGQIVKKVMEDLKEYGIVQRGFLGVLIRGINGNFAKEKNLSVSEGVYVDSLVANSAAAEAGIRPGDVILAVNGMATKTSSALLEYVARQRPGDTITITISRKGEKMDKKVTLKNSAGTTDLVNKEPTDEVSSKLGASFKPLDSKTKKDLGLNSGLQITNLGPGTLYKETDIRVGFIITKANGKVVNTVEDLMTIIKQAEGGVMLEGQYPNSNKKYYHAFGVS